MSSDFCFMMPGNPYNLDSLPGNKRYLSDAEKIIADNNFPSEEIKKIFMRNYQYQKSFYEGLSQTYYTEEHGGLGI